MSLDFRPYLKDTALWDTQIAEEALNSTFYAMFKKLSEERLKILEKHLRSAPDYPEVRYILGQISVTEANLDLLESIHNTVYPPTPIPEEKEEI